MYKFALCDNDKKIQEQMIYFFKMNIPNVILEVFHTGETLLREVKRGKVFDGIIVGNMELKYDGVSIISDLRDSGNRTPVILLSEQSYLNEEIFELEIFRYLMKPVKWAKLCGYVQLIIDQINHQNQYFLFKIDNKVHRVLFEDIIYFESSRRRVNLITKQGTYQFYDRLDIVEDNVRSKNVGFIRIHKSYLVNSVYIQLYEYSKVILMNGEIIPISENRRVGIKKEYFEFVGKELCGSSAHLLKSGLGE